MIELSKFDFNGLKPLDESLLSEADMLEVLGGQDTVYIYNTGDCKIYL
ncbi:hypothetical protein ACQRAV_13805 [Segatella copri]|jgi:hypothetical protein